MPIVDGDDVIKLSKERNPSVPVICVSGYNDIKTRTLADVHLVTPVEPSLLLSYINGYLG